MYISLNWKIFFLFFVDRGKYWNGISVYNCVCRLGKIDSDGGGFKVAEIGRDWEEEAVVRGGGIGVFSGRGEGRFNCLLCVSFDMLGGLVIYV